MGPRNCGFGHRLLGIAFVLTDNTQKAICWCIIYWFDFNQDISLSALLTGSHPKLGRKVVLDTICSTINTFVHMFQFLGELLCLSVLI